MNSVIAPALIGKDAADQKGLDDLMVQVRILHARRTAAVHYTDISSPSVVVAVCVCVIRSR